MESNLIIYTGITLIILGVILYFISSFMIKRIEKKLVNKYTFEMVKPKIKIKGKK